MRRRVILLPLCGALCACNPPAEPAPPPAAPAAAAAPPLSAQQAREKSERCDRISREEFGRASLEKGARAVSFGNHYNVKLDTCFYLLSTESAGVARKRLYDAGTRELYGEYSGAAEGRAETCRMEALHCASGHEWDSLARPYMEE